MSAACMWNGDSAAIVVLELRGGSVFPGASDASDVRR